MKKGTGNFLTDLFDDSFPFINMKNEGYHLRTNITELDGEYIFTIDVAGIKKENINISVEEGYLKVSINEQMESSTNNEKYIRKELEFNNIKRSYYVGEVSEENIKASLNQGLLIINVPKTIESNKKKTITIE